MEQFLIRLCNIHKIDKDIVISDWKSFDEETTKYNKMKKPELVEICKQFGYVHVGSKPELIINILNKVTVVEKVIKKKSVKQEPLKTDILSKLKSEVPPIVIRRNVHGNYEHPDTGFIFNQKTHEVVGKQLDNGEISAISKDDLEVCKQFNFKYVIPFNLTDSGTGEEDKILEDELDEENLISVEEEEEESEDEIEYDE